jgi:spore coat protein X
MSSDKKDNKHRQNDDTKNHKDDSTKKSSSGHSDKKSSSDDRDHDKKKRKDNQHDADVVQEADQFSSTSQESNELIFIKDSCNIDVHTTVTHAAVSLQVGLQLAIALVIRITIGDSDNGKNVAQDLLQHFDSEQSNKQKIVIENSKDVKIITTVTDVAVNIQALLQVLVTLVAKLDIL